MGTVMQRQTHKTLTAPRFFVSTRGVLMERRPNRSSRNTGYSMAFNDATRSEMQILADLLNDPQHAAALDAGWCPVIAWTLRCEAEKRGYRLAA